MPAWAESRAASAAKDCRRRCRAPARPRTSLHPADAQLGDFGVLQAEDVIIALSNTGETDEIVRLLETIKRIGARLIAITESDPAIRAQADGGRRRSIVHVSEEACPMNLGANRPARPPRSPSETRSR